MTQDVNTAATSRGDSADGADRNVEPKDFIARAVLNLRKQTGHDPATVPLNGTILPARSRITADRRPRRSQGLPQQPETGGGIRGGGTGGVGATGMAANEQALTPAQRAQHTGRPVKLNGRVWARPTRLDGRGDFSHRNPKPTRGMIREVIRSQGWGSQLAVARIMGDWESLVGPNIAAHTTPEEFNQEQGVLVIRCDSTPFTTNLRFMQSEMLKKIAASIGPNIVEELKILGPEIRRPVYGRLRIKGRGPRDDFG